MIAFWTCIFRFEPGAVHFRFTNIQNSSAWDGNYKTRPQACSFDRGTLPMVDINVIHMTKWTPASPSIFAHCKNWTMGWPGNEATHSIVDINWCSLA